MRISFWTIVAAALLLVSAPARAQTYDPNYPVCMHVFTGGFGGGGDYFECSFTSIPQCAASASGRAATCDLNPYYAGPPPTLRRRHHRRAY